MDVRQLTRLIGFAAQGSLILLGSTAVLAGHRSQEQPARPHMSAACAPNWGFNQTCWSRFPPVPGCPGSGYDSMPAGYENQPPQQLLYTPQNSLLLPDPQIVAPMYGNSQAPVSVYPNSAPQAGFGGMPAMPAPNGFPQSVTPPPQFGPAQVPLIPDGSSIPASPVPGVSSPLPPLPAPPLSAPGQSSLQPNMIMGPNRQMIVRPVSALTTPLTSSAGSRYGNSKLAQKLPAAPQIYVAPHSPALNSSLRGPQVPVTLATQSRVLPGEAASPSYRSGSAMPPVPGFAGPQFPPTQLPPIANYPTIPAEPLRRTP